ncbi:MAG TPA: PEP-CTERM sorting domain-containing protein, partial [Burkholderiales bacterium]|nr:PEP-CTERM sorting domain-containing protein [Burkholderiales bacterium]
MSLSGSVYAVTLDVLWYTYAQPTSEYVSFYSSLSGPGGVSTYPQSAGYNWNVSFFGPTDPAPTFANYDVLVIHSGEAFRTGTPLATPNYAGILNNKTAIEAARGTRTFISGSDADFHAVRGDSGTCPALNCGAFDGACGYVINAVNWAASGPGLGIVSFYHGEFAGSYWWDDPNSFLKSE